MSCISEDRSAARVALNVLLRGVVLATQRNCEHSDLFQSVVPVEQITDYHQHVDPESATICVEAILSRTRSCFYTSVHAFRREYEQILANALAYNSPGHGRHAFPAIIGWAQNLLDACRDELHAHRSELTAAETRLKDAMDAAEALDKNPKQCSETCDEALDPVTSLEALVAACELAAEQDGLEEEQQYLDDDCATVSEQRTKRQTEPCPSTNRELLSQGPTVSRRASLPAGPLQRVGSAPVKQSTTTAYDVAPKYRRHKSKVYIRPNKVVYLPTTFMEENFDALTLPVNCEMIVETNGTVLPDRHMVTIKSVPRQGLSTMYCMTNVMKFQQQFLNWQILNWTKVDEQHIKIHLQGPNSSPKNCKAEQEDDTLASVKSVPESHKRKSGSGCGRPKEHSSFDEVRQEEEAEEDRDEAPYAASHPARAHRHVQRSSPSHRCMPAMLPQAACLEDQAAGAALQQQLDNILGPPGRVSGSGSGSSSPGHAGHLLQPAEDLELQPLPDRQQQQRQSLADSGAGLPLPQALDLLKLQQLQQQLQYQHQQAVYNSSYQMAVPLWGLQGGAALGPGATMEDLLLQSLDDRQRAAAAGTHYTVNFPSIASGGKPSSQTAMLLQQLTPGSGDSLFAGFNGSMLGGMQVLEPTESRTSFKRFKADTDAAAALAAMASGRPGAGDCRTLQSLMMTDPNAVAAALASNAAAFAAAANGGTVGSSGGKRSFNGSSVTAQAAYACNLQHALSM